MAEVIESLRSEERFTAMYKQVVEMASTTGVIPVKKRIIVKQQN